MSIDTIATFKTVAAAIYNGLNALETINEQAKALKANGIVFGKSIQTCQYRVQFKDAMKAQFKGKAEKTYSNYVTGFVAAVNKGVPFSFSSSKGKADGSKDDAAPKKATTKSDTEKMVGALLTVWKLSDVGNDVLIQIETAMANGTPLIDAIEDVLKFHGAKLAE
jgi:hypothetical protein